LVWAARQSLRRGVDRVKTASRRTQEGRLDVGIGSVGIGSVGIGSVGIGSVGIGVRQNCGCACLSCIASQVSSCRQLERHSLPRQLKGEAAVREACLQILAMGLELNVRPGWLMVGQ
jgi:hypothetical protein